MIRVPREIRDPIDPCADPQHHAAKELLPGLRAQGWPGDVRRACLCLCLRLCLCLLGWSIIGKTVTATSTCQRQFMWQSPLIRLRSEAAGLRKAVRRTVGDVRSFRNGFWSRSATAGLHRWVAFGPPRSAPRHSCTRRFAEKGFSVLSQLPISTSMCNDRVTVGKVFLSLRLLGGSTGR